MELERHEQLMGELNDPELSHERKTEILQELRNDYSAEWTTKTELLTTKEKLEKEKEDLIKANGKLFLQSNFIPNDKKEEVEKKTVSETITISDIEKRARR